MKIQVVFSTLYTAARPRRYDILKFLYDVGLAHFDEIRPAIGLQEKDRHWVSFILNDLEEYGMIKSSFRVITEPTEGKKGRAGTFYELTDLGKIIYEALHGVLEKLEDF